MANDKDVVVAVLRKVADAIKNLDSADWAAVLDGNFRVDIVIPAARDQQPDSGAVSLSEGDLADIARLLNDATSREAGQTLFDARNLSKDGILQLARHLDVRAQKRDPVDKIKERIIEATIGFRLRSRAVQGGKPEVEKSEDSSAKEGRSV